MREDARTKGRRYVAEGRLTVTRADGDHVIATCRGNGAIYRLGHNPSRGWWCTCPARGTCAHVHALGLVTVITKEDS